jgi:hypothetical protein
MPLRAGPRRASHGPPGTHARLYIYIINVFWVFLVLIFVSLAAHQPPFFHTHPSHTINFNPPFQSIDHHHHHHHSPPPIPSHATINQPPGLHGPRAARAHRQLAPGARFPAACLEGIYVYIYVYGCTWMWMWMWMWMCVDWCVCVMCIYVCVCGCGCMCVCGLMCMCVCMCGLVCLCMCVGVGVYVYMCMCVCVCVAT